MISSETILATRCKRTYSNAHTYHINSIALSSDMETFISGGRATYGQAAKLGWAPLVERLHGAGPMGLRRIVWAAVGGWTQQRLLE